MGYQSSASGITSLSDNCPHVQGMWNLLEHRNIARALLLYLLVAAMISASFLVPTLISAILTYVLIIIVTLLFNYYSRGSFFWGGGLGLGVVLAAFLISGVFAIEMGLGLVRLGALVPHVWAFLIGAAVFEVLISVGEELSFRGYILPNLILELGVLRGVYLSAALFALLHIPSMVSMSLDPLHILIMSATVFVAGVLLAFCYLYYGLRMAIGFHFMWNFLQYHVYSLREGFGIYDVSASAPLWTGGMWGPEAGLLGLFTLLTGIGTLQLLKRVKELNTLQDR